MLATIRRLFALPSLEVRAAIHEFYRTGDTTSLLAACDCVRETDDFAPFHELAGHVCAGILEQK